MEPPLANPSHFPGIDGFLQTRGSVMLDFVFVAMIAVVPILGWSIWLAKRGNFQWHKRVQISLGLILLVAVTAFELEMRLVGWKERAQPSRFWAGPEWKDPVHYSLAVHLFFAIPTTLLWIGVIAGALRKFSRPPVPGSHSRIHRFWGAVAAFEMVMTAITGWIFYWFAFVA